jgi:hypothetical protein
MEYHVQVLCRIIVAISQHHAMCPEFNHNRHYCLIFVDLALAGTITTTTMDNFLPEPLLNVMIQWSEKNI